MNSLPHSRPQSRLRRLLGRREWLLLFLAGPVLWYLHFWAVYLLAEAYCTFEGAGDGSATPSLLSVLVIGATVVAVGVIAWTTLRAARADPSAGHRGELAWVGMLLGGVFAVATALVGLSALLVPPC